MAPNPMNAQRLARRLFRTHRYRAHDPACPKLCYEGFIVWGLARPGRARPGPCTVKTAELRAQWPNKLRSNSDGAIPARPGQTLPHY